MGVAVFTAIKKNGGCKSPHLGIHWKKTIFFNLLFSNWNGYCCWIHYHRI